MLQARARSSLGVKIGGPFDYDSGGPGGWWIVNEPELHPGEDILAPDLAGWRRERMPVYPDTAYVTLAPDWVCEVVSPGTGRLDRHEKRPVHAREGAPHLWLVDPLVRGLEAYELYEGKCLPIASAKDDEPVNVGRSMPPPSARAISGPDRRMQLPARMCGRGRKQGPCQDGAAYRNESRRQAPHTAVHAMHFAPGPTS
ncbi:MAG: Uma2 family endonuclease [Alphaproteobacteria bacterium]|nr:Uma2 family endonuclease [Alphaproteobacteria bacterium]